VSNSNLIANKLNSQLKKHGSSELDFPKSLFSGKSSEKAGISGQIKGRRFKVIMFEPSNEAELPAVSAHLSSNISDLRLSDEQIAFWNSDNRFTKLYRQDEDHAFIVYDSFFPASDEEMFIQSVARFWSDSMEEISKFKMACERRGIF
jgi:hypothetical protein